MKKNLIIASFFLVTLALALTIGDVALAQDPGSASLDLLGKTGLGGATPTEAGNQLPLIIGKLIRSALGLLGIVMVVLMLYAGFLWMTAMGNTEKVDKAKSTISRAIIGAVIIFSAYAISGFVISAIVSAGK